MFCSACGTNNDTAAKFCRACGAALGDASPPAAPPEQETMRGAGERRPGAVHHPSGKNPVVAAVLSAVIVGVGQFYNGDMKKGAVMLLGAVLLGAATAGVAWLALAIWSAIDAYQVAKGTGKMW